MISENHNPVKVDIVNNLSTLYVTFQQCVRLGSLKRGPTGLGKPQQMDNRLSCRQVLLLEGVHANLKSSTRKSITWKSTTKGRVPQGSVPHNQEYHEERTTRRVSHKEEYTGKSTIRNSPWVTTIHYLHYRHARSPGGSVG